MADYPTDSDIDTTFPDNTTGEIGADDMRAFQKEMTAAGRDYAAMTENVPTAFPPAQHNHMKADITDFAHTHVKGDITDFAHTHPQSDITDLVADQDAQDDAIMDLATQLGGYTLAVVDTLPGTPDPNTIYFVTTT